MNIIEKRRVEEVGWEEGRGSGWGASGGIYIFKRSERLLVFPAILTVQGNWPHAAGRPPIYSPPTGSRSAF